MTQVVNPSTREPGDLGQGPPCRHWIGVDRRYCGATERVRLYLTGPCCPAHTPAAVAGQPEPTKDTTRSDAA